MHRARRQDCLYLAIHNSQPDGYRQNALDGPEKKKRPMWGSEQRPDVGVFWSRV